MNEESLLYRHVHPSFWQAGRVSSQAFRPTPKDLQFLSVYDGEAITVERSWEHFTGTLRCPSVGVMGVSNGECRQLDLAARPDPLPDFPEHAVIDFRAFSKSETERKAKLLKAVAEARGWLLRRVD